MEAVYQAGQQIRGRERVCVVIEVKTLRGRNAVVLLLGVTTCKGLFRVRLEPGIYG